MDDTFLEDLVNHEMSTYFKEYCSDYRQAMILLSGVALNHMGDVLGNSSAKFERKDIKISDIILGGTNPNIDDITIRLAQRDPEILRKLIREDKSIRDTLHIFSSSGTETILVVDKGNGKYSMLDGMHRVIGHILSGKSHIDAYVLKNEGQFLPNIEAHVIYDIIKSFQRSKKSKQDEEDLVGAIRLLIKNTQNTKELLETRFDILHVKDQYIQSLITQALK